MRALLHSLKTGRLLLGSAFDAKSSMCNDCLTKGSWQHEEAEVFEDFLQGFSASGSKLPRRRQAVWRNTGDLIQPQPPGHIQPKPQIVRPVPSPKPKSVSPPKVHK